MLKVEIKDLKKDKELYNWLQKEIPYDLSNDYIWIEHKEWDTEQDHSMWFNIIGNTTLIATSWYERFFCITKEELRDFLNDLLEYDARNKEI